jgi:hypothetical protein
MPTPSAKFYVSVNSGANQDGGIDVPSAANIQFVPQSTVGWLRVRWEIYDYPEGWSTPTGWTLDANGTIYSTDFTPDDFTLPAAATLWGVWMPRCLVNEQIDNDQEVLGSLLDDTTAISMLSPDGLRDIGARESSQFTTTTTRVKGWLRSYQRSLRTLDTLLAALGSVAVGDITGLAAGVAAFLADPTSAKLRTALTDETGTGAAVFATSPTLTTPVINGQTQGAAVTIAALEIDWAASPVHKKTLASGGNTFTFANAASGMVIVVALKSHGSGSTVTWPTVKWAGGTPPTQSTPDKTDVYTFVHDGTDIYGSVVQDMS